MQNYQIELASSTDLDQIWSVISTCAKWLEEQGMNQWSSWYTKDHVEELLAENECFLVRSDNKVVSVAFLSRKPSEYYYENEENENHLLKFTEPEANAYYGHALAVLPEYQGQGIAKLQIAHVEKVALERKVKYFRFDARGDYHKLIDFYKKLGYKIVGELPDDDSPYYLFEKKIF